VAVERTPRYLGVTVQGIIRRFHSPDVYDLRHWSPDDPTCFGFLLQALIGPKDGEGEESFDFVVCSPKWLRRKYGDDAAILGRYHILLFVYDFDRIREAIEAIVAHATGSNWREVASKIARHGRWEFENYRELPV